MYWSSAVVYMVCTKLPCQTLNLTVADAVNHAFREHAMSSTSLSLCTNPGLLLLMYAALSSLVSGASCQRVLLQSLTKSSSSIFSSKPKIPELDIGYNAVAGIAESLRK